MGGWGQFHIAAASWYRRAAPGPARRGEEWPWRKVGYVPGTASSPALTALTAKPEIRPRVCSAPQTLGCTGCMRRSCLSITGWWLGSGIPPPVGGETQYQEIPVWECDTVPGSGNTGTREKLTDGVEK